ncbi:MAG TPA: hypothetical protein VNK23_13655 [Candidatus Dormibacteraeota bacterium]|nr:hypothetical protein [Candidatus Dormibacteraeota bacterium]
MRVPRPFLLLFAAFLVAVPASAQTTSTAPATSDPQAVALVQKSLAALTGGLAVTDVTLTGSSRRVAGSDDETGTATLEATSAGDSRVELSFGSGNRVEIRNHAGAPLPNALPPAVPLPSAAMQPQPVGAWSGPDGVLHGMAQQNTLTEAAWFFPAQAVGDIAKAPLWVLTYVGPETHDGVSVVHIQAAQEIPAIANAPQQVVDSILRLTRTDLYFDPNSLLPVALAFNTHPHNNAFVDIPVEVRFSNYQSVNGVAVPTDVQKYVNRGLVLDLQFSKVTLNSGLTASAFALQ